MMVNGSVEIHDPPANPPASPDSMRGSPEYRLLMAYASRRRPASEPLPPPDATEISNANGSAPQEETTTVRRKKKKKKGWKRLQSIFRCVKPQSEETAGTEETEETEEQRPMAPGPRYRCFHPEAPEGRRSSSAADEDEDAGADPLAAAASRLMALTDEIPFSPAEIESDAPEGSPSPEVEVVIGLLLRESGDRINEELKDVDVAAELFWNYGFFRSLMNGVLSRMGLRSADPDAPGPQASPKTQIAVACEITSRLSAIDTLPMSRLLENGARYLQDFYTPWAQQHGGYEAALRDEDEEDEVQ